MSVKTGQSWAGRFTTHGSTGVAVDADSTPTGTLIVDGDTNAATVTITDAGVGIYKWSVTLPTLTAGQTVQMQVSATVATVAATAVVCSAQADTVLESDTYAKVDTEVADIQARLPAALVSGRIDASVGAMAADVVTAAAIAADAITDAKVAADVTIASVTGAVGSVTGAVGSVTGNVGGNVVGSVGSVSGAVGSVTGNVGGNVAGSVGSVTGSVGSVAAGGITASSIAADAIGAAELATDACQKIADVALRRTMASIEASNNGETLSVESLYGLIAAAFEASLASTTLTVRKSDGSTLGTKTLTTDAAAVPVTGIT